MELNRANFASSFCHLTADCSAIVKEHNFVVHPVVAFAQTFAVRKVIVVPVIAAAAEVVAGKQSDLVVAHYQWAVAAGYCS